MAVLYRAMKHQGVSIPQVNEMELWEVAVAFGMDEDQKPRLVSKGEAAPTRLEDMPLAEQERIRKVRERIKARKTQPQEPAI